MAKVTAAVDITYPDDEGRPVVKYKQGEEIKDRKLIDMWTIHGKELIKLEPDKPVKKPSQAGKKK